MIITSKGNKLLTMNEYCSEEHRGKPCETCDVKPLCDVLHGHLYKYKNIYIEVKDDE